MVKLAGPVMSLDASGKLGKSIVFSKWKGRNYARSLVTPENPKSAGQVGVRSMFRFLAQIWAAIGTTPQGSWLVRAATTTVSAFNAFMGFNQQRFRNFLPPMKTDGATPAAPTGTYGVFAAVAGIRQITVTQPVTAAGTTWGLAFFRGAAAPTPAYSNLVYVLPTDGTNDVVFVDTPLVAGTYHYKNKPFSITGAWGADSADVNATVP